MLASYKWLCELCQIEASVDEVAARLTEAGLEIEGIKRYGDLPSVVVAEVRHKQPHPKRDNLTQVTVFDGDGEVSVVCGAPNVPEPGGRVLFAREGAVLPGGMQIGARKLGGVESRGMICSEVELDIGSEEDGIFVLDPSHEVVPGTPAERALELTDWVLEVGLTPNRPDCLGHLGLARELAAIFETELLPPAAVSPKALLAAAEPSSEARPVGLFEGETTRPVRASVPLHVADPARCPRYAAAVVEDVRVAQSPFWLRYRLHVLGLRAINNAVDITNYVLMEYGYPTHAFDLDQLRGPRIDVRVGRAGERVVTLDGQEHAVGDDDLLICDAEGPVAVAGVMGGDRSGVREETTRVLVECAYFDPRGVRRTSRRLGLHTDSSHRFERGVDPRAVPAVLARACGLLAELAGGVPTACGSQVYPQPVTPQTIGMRGARLSALLGSPISLKESRGILERLGCVVQFGDNDTLRVQAPTWRPDLRLEEDLIEEVARIYGYDRLPTAPPRTLAACEGADTFPAFVRKLRMRAAHAGLTEAVNYAFVSQAQLEAAKVPLDAVRLANPLSEERARMRTSLLPGLATNARRAQRHQVERVAIFELARVFHPGSEELPDQPYKFAMVLCGPQRGWIGPGQPMDFFDGEGHAGGGRPTGRRGAAAGRDRREPGRGVPVPDPRRCARLRVGDGDVGVMGELHPDVLEALELHGPVVYAELDVRDLHELSEPDGAVKVRAVPRFPASPRDLAVEVDEGVQAGSVAAVLRKAGGDLLESVELFDLYRGDQVAAGKKSLAFRLVYRDPEGTLTDKRVDKAHKQLVQAAQRELGAVLRG